jgi:hypothetical protein
MIDVLTAHEVAIVSDEAKKVTLDLCLLLMPYDIADGLVGGHYATGVSATIADYLANNPTVCEVIRTCESQTDISHYS